MKESLTWEEKMLGICLYVLMVGFPPLIIVVVLLNKSDFIRAHINRAIVASIIYTVFFILDYKDINIFLDHNIFLAAVAIISMIQVAISNKKYWFWFDKIKVFTHDKLEMGNIIWVTILTVLPFIIAIILGGFNIC